MNLQEKAYELEKAIKESEAYVALKKAYDAVETDPEAKKMFDSFRDVQLSLQQKQQSGQTISQEEAEMAQNQLQLLQQHPIISQLMMCEQAMSQLIEEMNRIITKPLVDLYQVPNN